VKKILALSICLLLLLAFALASADKPALAIADSDLLNYEKEAGVVNRGVCDNGQTKVVLYDHWEYELYAAVTASGETYLYFDTVESEKFFMKTDDKAVEMAYEAWDSMLKAASPNLYAYMHGGNHDCRDQLKS